MRVWKCRATVDGDAPIPHCVVSLTDFMAVMEQTSVPPAGQFTPTAVRCFALIVHHQLC